MNETNAKSLFWYLLNAVLVLILIGGLFGIGAVLRASNAIAPSRTIVVTGEGKVNIKPDLATVAFAVVSQGADPKVLAEENAEKINRAIAYVKEKGLSDKDIKTTDYNLYPRYDWNELTRENKIIGYEIRETVSLKIRDLEKVGEIVGGLTSVGINEIHSLAFSVEDPEAQRNQARLEAFDEARAKAAAMASANGVSLARVITFSENYGGGYPPILYAKEALGRGGADAAAIPEIAPGEQEVTVTVSVTYEIR